MTPSREMNSVTISLRISEPEREVVAPAPVQDRRPRAVAGLDIDVAGVGDDGRGHLQRSAVGRGDPLGVVRIVAAANEHGSVRGPPDRVYVQRYRHEARSEGLHD